MTTVEGTLNGHSFKATLEPDGQGSHWLKVSRKLREAADAEVGDEVALGIMPAAGQPGPEVPPDLRKALAATPEAMALWSDITLVARRGLDPLDHIGVAKQVRLERIVRGHQLMPGFCLADR